MKQVHVPDRETWRAWLKKHHETEDIVEMISHKKHTGKPSISHRASMEEAICFGWIDTTVKKLDEARYIRTFRKRTDKSRWSNNTLSYAKEMVEQGKMMPAGLKRYKEGLKKPTIDLNLPKNHVPKELRAILKKNKKAAAGFEKLAPSLKKMHIHMIERGKLPETRKKRVDAFVKLCEKA